MKEKSTDELNMILGSTHIEDISAYLVENKDSLLSGDRPFSDYMHGIVREKKLKQQDVFLDADIPERYGYKLISEEKRTKQRDIILRICYAAEMTLVETQRALKLYHMPELYSKIPRDAMLMVAFNERPGSVVDVNVFLEKNGVEALRSSGAQE
ncbi:MAG: hypothetical protein K6G24_09850 [Lachnospiraceae bacterium]|nr:hypothetical protein [Lachnospiraceae bacterium]